MNNEKLKNNNFNYINFEFIHYEIIYSAGTIEHIYSANGAYYISNQVIF